MEPEELAFRRRTPLMALFEEPDKTQESQQMKKPDPAPVPVFADFVEVMTEHFGDYDGIYGTSDGPKILIAATADCFALAHAMVRAVQNDLALEKYMNAVMQREAKRTEKAVAEQQKELDTMELKLAEYVDRGSKGDPLSK